MNLATHQRILLGLIRDTYAPRPGDDSYYHRVAACPDLQEARGNILLWRVYVLERTCVLTVELLRQRGELDAALHTFMQTHNVSPFREYQPLAFLAFLAGDRDPVVVSVSQFELALIKVRGGDKRRYAVHWTVDPHCVLLCLAQGLPFATTTDGCRYVTRVAATLPHGFVVETVDIGEIGAIADMVDMVDMVDTVEMVEMVEMVETVDTADKPGTAHKVEMAPMQDTAPTLDQAHLLDMADALAALHMAEHSAARTASVPAGTRSAPFRAAAARAHPAPM